MQIKSPCPDKLSYDHRLDLDLDLDYVNFIWKLFANLRSVKSVLENSHYEVCKSQNNFRKVDLFAWNQCILGL